MVMQAIILYSTIRHHRFRRFTRAPRRNWDEDRAIVLHRLYNMSDRVCHEQLRMKRGPFHRLCASLRTYGLRDSWFVRVEEQVAIFLTTVGHDERNRVESLHFFRSGQTVSHYFHRVLDACLMLYRDIVTNATAANSPYDKDHVEDWYHYFEVRSCY